MTTVEIWNKTASRKVSGNATPAAAPASETNTLTGKVYYISVIKCIHRKGIFDSQSRNGRKSEIYSIS